MDGPTVTLVKRATWTGNAGDPYVHERFEIRGGDVSADWLDSLRVPNLPWCERCAKGLTSPQREVLAKRWARYLADLEKPEQNVVRARR